MGSLLIDNVSCRGNDPGSVDVGGIVVVTVVDMDSWELETGMVVADVFDRLVPTSCL